MATPPRLIEAWPMIATFANVAKAHRMARRGKMGTPEVARFHLDWELEVARLSEELADLRWVPGPFRHFTLYEGKKRLISAVPYRDRVVHQAIMNILAPAIEARLIDDTFACRIGKGTEAARARAQELLGRHRYFLHLDVRQYFPSILQPRLKSLLREVVDDQALLSVLDRIIDHDGKMMPGDLVEMAERRSVPIGSLTSQWFANFYLSSVDHLAMAMEGVGGYVRYMDDIVLFGDSKRLLWKAEASLRRHAHEELGLELHAAPRLAPHEEGLSFLGIRVWARERRLLPPSGYRFRRRMKGALRALASGRTSPERLRCQVAGWMGHARLANTVALRRAIFADLRQGRHPEGRTA